MAREGRRWATSFRHRARALSAQTRGPYSVHPCSRCSKKHPVLFKLPEGGSPPPTSAELTEARITPPRFPVLTSAEFAVARITPPRCLPRTSAEFAMAGTGTFHLRLGSSNSQYSRSFRRRLSRVGVGSPTFGGRRAATAMDGGSAGNAGSNCPQGLWLGGW